MTNYNLTLMQEANTVPAYVDVVNTYTEGILMGFFLLAIFMVMVMIMKQSTEFDKALLVSSFICFIFSLWLKVAGWINFYFVILFLIFTALTGFYMVINKR